MGLCETILAIRSIGTYKGEPFHQMKPLLHVIFLITEVHPMNDFRVPLSLYVCDNLVFRTYLNK